LPLRTANTFDATAIFVYTKCDRKQGRNMTAPQKHQPPSPPQRVGVREFRADLTGFLRQVRAGNAFLITSHDQVLAELRPPPATQQPKRRPGALRGKIHMEPDFDSLPPDVLDAMEGDEA
jgi:antitoxin (DNA-binding transcriptional repressor) of toxin-antitoxin stability system